MKYSDVFSCGNENMGLTKVISYEIPLAAGIAPIKQPTQRLGREKGKEVSR